MWRYVRWCWINAATASTVWAEASCTTPTQDRNGRNACGRPASCSTPCNGSTDPGLIFATAPMTPELIETVLADANGEIALLAGHLQRLGASCEALGYPYDAQAIARDLRIAAVSLATPGPHRP